MADAPNIGVAAPERTGRHRWFGAWTTPDDRAYFRLAVGLAVAPILIAVVRNGLLGWYPTGDAAYMAVRVNDVFSAHPPLAGLPAETGRFTGTGYSYPGAILMYLLAVPVKVLGVAWGVLVGMGLLNTAWFVMAMWMIRRRVGYRFGILACVFGASLIWALGSQTLVNPTPVQACAIAFPAFLAVAWSIADGDSAAIVPLVVTVSFLIMTHLKFALVVPGISVVAVVSWFLARRGRHPSTGERRSARVQVRIATAVALVLWIPPLVEQFTAESGNLGRLLSTAVSGTASTGASRTLIDAVGVVSAPLVSAPLWLRNSLEHPNFTGAGPGLSFLGEALAIALIMCVSALVVERARPQRLTNVLCGLAIAWSGWGLWVVSAFLNPDDVPYRQNYFLELWPLSMFLWLVLTLGYLQTRDASSRPGTRVRTSLRLAGLGIVLLFAVASIPIANFGGGSAGSGTTQESIPLATTIRSGILANVPLGGAILVESPTYPARRYLPVAILALQEKGIPFRVAPGWDSTLYGSQRMFDPDPPNATRRLEITMIPNRSPSAVLVAHAHLPYRLDAGKRARAERIVAEWEAGVENPDEIAWPGSIADEGIGSPDWFRQQWSDSEKSGTPLLDNPQVVEVLATASRSDIGALLKLSPEDAALVHAWVEDRAGDVWVWLAPL